jgi:hypothetical protein
MLKAMSSCAAAANRIQCFWMVAAVNCIPAILISPLDVSGVNVGAVVGAVVRIALAVIAVLITVLSIVRCSVTAVEADNEMDVEGEG